MISFNRAFAQKLVWALPLVSISGLATSATTTSTLTYLIPLDLLLTLLTVLWLGFSFKHPTLQWLGSLLPSAIQSLAIVIFGLCVWAKGSTPSSNIISLTSAGCVPASLQFLFCFLGLPTHHHLLPMLTVVLVYLVLIWTSGFDPLSLILTMAAFVQSCVLTLSDTNAISTFLSFRDKSRHTGSSAIVPVVSSSPHQVCEPEWSRKPSLAVFAHTAFADPEALGTVGPTESTPKPLDPTEESLTESAGILLPGGGLRQPCTSMEISGSGSGSFLIPHSGSLAISIPTFGTSPSLNLANTVGGVSPQITRSSSAQRYRASPSFSTTAMAPSVVNQSENSEKVAKFPMSPTSNGTSNGLVDGELAVDILPVSPLSLQRLGLLDEPQSALPDTVEPKTSFAEISRKYRVTKVLYEENLRQVTTLQEQLAQKDKIIAELTSQLDQENQKSNLPVNFLDNPSSLISITHDLRSPLATALSILEIVLSPVSYFENPEIERRDLLEKARTSLLTMLSLVNNILDYSKLDHTGVEIAPTACNLRKDVIQLLRTMEIQAKQQNVGLVFHPSADLPTSVSCDKNLLQRILTNLISNGLKFCNPVDGLLNLRLEYHQPRQMLQVSVVDNGMGMSQVEQESVFDRFYQGSHSRGGTGLGLTICQQLVEAMGGSIRAWSEGLGLGSTFWFEIAAPVVKQQPAHSSMLTAMIIDANCARKEALTAELQYLGVVVFENEPQEDALHFLFVSGDETIENRLPISPEMTVLVTTNTSSAPVLNGYDATLCSPIDIEDLRKILAKHPLASPSLTSTESPSNVPEGQTKCQPLAFLASSPITCSSEVSAVTLKPVQSIGYEETTSGHPSHPQPQPLHPTDVLLVEDSSTNLVLFRRHLANLGVTNVDSALNGLQAIELTKHKRYDLVVLDCEMPVLGGVAAALEIRKLPEYRISDPKTLPNKAPILVALTGDPSQENIQQCKAAGMDHFFVKPVFGSEWKSIVALVSN